MLRRRQPLTAGGGVTTPGHGVAKLWTAFANAVSLVVFRPTH